MVDPALFIYLVGMTIHFGIYTHGTQYCGIMQKASSPRHGGEDRGEGDLFLQIFFTPHPDLLPSRGEGTLHSTALTTIVSAKSRGCRTDKFNCHEPLMPFLKNIRSGGYRHSPDTLNREPLVML